MHILKNSTPLPAHYGMTLPPGEWLMNDSEAFALGVRAERRTVHISYYEKSRINPEWMALPPLASINSILVIRSGAIGDLLLLSPALKALKAKYPDARMALSCFPAHHAIFKATLASLYIDVISYPMRPCDADEYDLVVPLENVIEAATEKGVHATDAFAEALGVDLTDSKPLYQITGEELIWLNRSQYALPNGMPTGKRVALHIHSSSAIRDYPLNNWLEVIDTLLERGWEIVLMGKNDKFRTNHPQIKECSSLTFREASAVLSTCDVFCGVDSSFFNLCPALGVPAIGLFGPVDWRTRVKPGSGQIALHREAACAPCGWTNGRAGQRWPTGGPCNAEGRCVPLSEIEPKRIVSMIEREAKK